MNETKARAIVTARSGGMCELCRSARAASWAHRLPAGQGGPWTPSNGLHLCGDGVRGCHGWSERHRHASYDSGWLLKRGMDWRTTVVWLQPFALPAGWYGLDDDGCFTWIYPPDLNLPEVPAVLPPWIPTRSLTLPGRT